MPNQCKTLNHPAKFRHSIHALNIKIYRKQQSSYRQIKKRETTNYRNKPQPTLFYQHLPDSLIYMLAYRERPRQIECRDQTLKSQKHVMNLLKY